MIMSSSAQNRNVICRILIFDPEGLQTMATTEETELDKKVKILRDSFGQYPGTTCYMA